MRLSRESFNLLYDALKARYPDHEKLKTMARRCYRPTSEFSGPSDDSETIIRKLIDDCSARDGLQAFVECIKGDADGNRLIEGLDFDTFTEEPSDEEVVEAGSGSAGYKTELIAALGQLDQPGLHLVAVEDLAKLLDAASDTEARTLYLAVLGNLKVDRPEEVVRGLSSLIGKLLARLIGTGPRPDEFELDLDRARLARVDLGGLDLHRADVAFADLREANLDGANLWRARGYAVNISKAGFRGGNLEEVRFHKAVAVQARFHDCRMVSAFFKQADLTRAEFQQSRLQGAHFETADLRGARFEQANIADAYFTGAIFDDTSLASLSRAAGWDRARLDETARDAVARLVETD